MADATPGQFIWYDLLTSDPVEAASFYAHVIGWTSRPLETTDASETYTLWASSQGPVSGTTTLPEHARKMSAPPHWISNVHVADVDASTACAQKLGGRVIVEPSDFPGVGRLAVIGDPQGTSIHLFKPNAAKRLHDSNKPGEFVWHELMTTDHEAAFAFYRELFGWQKVRDFDLGDLGTYLVYGLAGQELGGMLKKPKEMTAPAWFYYIEVSDLDAAIERAKRKGGRVLNGPVPVPGGARIVQLADPKGAFFALHEAAFPR